MPGSLVSSLTEKILAGLSVVMTLDLMKLFGLNWDSIDQFNGYSMISIARWLIIGP